MNVLVCAYRDDIPEHQRCRRWLEGVVKGPAAFAVSDLVLSGFVRIVTNPRVFRVPSPVGHAIEFVDRIRDLDHCLRIAPGPRHWSIFTGLCRGSEARGNLIPDAFVAALAIESGAEWVTMDGDFARFPGLRWKRPPQVVR